SGIGNVIDGLADILCQIPDWIFGKFKAGISWLMNIGGAVADGFKDAFSWFSDLGGTIWTAMSGLPKAIADAIGGVGSGIVSWLNPFDDFVITKTGQIIRTNPNDFIIGTKTPHALGGSTNVKNIENNITINVAGVIDDAMVQEIAYKIKEEVNRAVGVV
ncbi:MAG: hypothetical protein U9R01_07060, partial [candidate division WOR-3 bacterium]|nr:hypothetical protein [candidate division WOR-3 bacterium]